MNQTDAAELEAITDAELRSACLLAVALCNKFDLPDDDMPPYWLLVASEAQNRGWVTEDPNDLIAECLAGQEAVSGPLLHPYQ